MSGRPAVFFDFDKTLLRTDSGSLGFRYMWEQREVSLSFLLRVIAASYLYKWRLISAERLTQFALGHYRGQPIAKFREGANAFYQNLLRPNLSPAMLAKLEEHRDAGHVLVLLSASIDYYLEPVVEEFGFDHLLCSRLEMVDGICTGRSAGPLIIGPQKKTAAIELSRGHEIDLQASFAYADHLSDVPLLETVGHPVAVRPSAPLRKIAVQRNWPIIDAE
ncbi:MAG: HAD family hydrolase [Candidatus Lernaella stagnicola]|nr:HAD family hydrolase [Candidatus Lernaella stagnicola]